MKITALQMVIREQGSASAELCVNIGRCSNGEKRVGVENQSLQFQIQH